MSHLAHAGMYMQSAFVLAERPVPEVLARIRHGLPASMFDQIAATLGLSTSLLAAKLGIARRTLTRKHGMGTPLSAEVSEKVLRVARICNLARSLFATDHAISLARGARDSGPPQADQRPSAVPVFRGRDP